MCKLNHCKGRSGRTDRKFHEMGTHYFPETDIPTPPSLSLPSLNHCWHYFQVTSWLLQSQLPAQLTCFTKQQEIIQLFSPSLFLYDLNPLKQVLRVIKVDSNRVGSRTGQRPSKRSFSLNRSIQ